MLLTQKDARMIAGKLRIKIEKGRKHDIAVFRHKGVQILQYGISRASREKPHNHISRQLHITSGQCRDLRDCPLTLNEYIEILTQKNLIQP